MPNKAYIRIVAASVLFLGVCCLWGCYNKTYISFEEHSSHATDSLTAVSMESKKTVSKAILKSGAVVTFNKAGGQLDPEQQIITGIASDGTENGTVVEVNYSDIYALQLKEHSSRKTMLLLISAGLVVTRVL